MFRHVDVYQPVPESVTNLLATLGDHQRQQVLRVFLDARSWELAATAIAEGCAPLSRPAVSHHLGVMRRTNVLTARREGKHIYYAINRPYIEQALQSFLAFLDVCCVPSGDCTADTAETEAAR
jgi:DNA-binding transcriptional ArsR family regulator